MIAAVLAVHLLAGVQAQVPPQYQKEYQEALKMKRMHRYPKPTEYMPGGKAPKTCADECNVLDKSMTDTCKRQAQKKPQFAKGCNTRKEDMVRLCKESCEKKGKIDPQYIKEHAPKPHAPPGRSGPKPARFGNSEE